MSSAKLAYALGAINWSGNISALLIAPDSLASRLEAMGLYVAQWARQLENVEKENPALCFVREMQLSAQNVAILVAVGLYKPAAASMRGVVEAALYYTYFRTHPAELSTLAQEGGFYVSKKEIMDFHKSHTKSFNDKQSRLGLQDRLGKWYSRISAVVHGQVPGSWSTYSSIKDVSYSKLAADTAILEFEEAIQILRRLLLCTVAAELWHGFASSAKVNFLTGLTADQRLVLMLDKR